MLACQDAIVGRSEEDILDIQLMVSGFTIDVAEALGILLGGSVLSAAGFRKGRLNEMTLANQVPYASNCALLLRLGDWVLRSVFVPILIKILTL